MAKPLLALLDIQIKLIADIEKVEAFMVKSGLKDRAYAAFFPLIRLKGHFLKMHITKLSKYQRYIYLNPIEVVLISYKNTNKFPHAPNYIINLNNIQRL